MNTLLCVSKAGGYREDLVKKLEQTGFHVVPSDPDPVKTVAEAKKANPNVLLIDFSGNHQDSKMARETAQKLAEEFRSVPMYVIGVEKQKIELTKVQLGKNKTLKIVEEKLLYTLIKTHVERSSSAGSETPAASVASPSKPKSSESSVKKAETPPPAPKESVKSPEKTVPKKEEKEKGDKKTKTSDTKEKAVKEKETPKEKIPEKQKKPTEAKGKEEPSGKSKSKK